LAQRKNRKAKRKVIATSTAYEAFKAFFADKTSKIVLKYIEERYPEGYRPKDKQIFLKFFSDFFECGVPYPATSVYIHTNFWFGVRALRTNL
jgi:hypothetical protein